MTSVRIPITRYFCKKDADEDRVYSIINSPIFRGWKASGFANFKDEESGIRFEHPKSRAEVHIRKDGIGNVVVSVACDFKHSYEEAFSELERSTGVRLVSRRAYV